MALLDQIEQDFKSAYKGGDKRKVEILRFVKAAVQKAAIDKREDKLEDADITKIISKQVKQCKETLEAAKQGSRQDVIDQSDEEIKILEAYLPKQLSADEINKLIDEAIQEVGSNQGQIMKHVLAKSAGAADGKTVSQLVGAKLRPAK